ncbi:MAG: ferredoxin [Bacteroidetes bacterium GWE2_29_8]|nr:MAG: ferredoxin [Bacteroidetes bacterium GWE2_29_8]OFY24574.1 MAG: ferredoxin [Bacteroidetes bacterium GWF2_29_10]
MYKIDKHPIIDIPKEEKHQFLFDGKLIYGFKGHTIASALHLAGHNVHSHSLTGRNRSLECGIGKCGACEMLVDGEIKRICITKCDDVKEVKIISEYFLPENQPEIKSKEIKKYKTQVLIIGAGPAGLATRKKLNKFGISNILIDSNENIGGQFNMQTHQFFFFERERQFGGLRGFEITKHLEGEASSNMVMTNCTAWDILEGNKVAVKNFKTKEIFYIEPDFLVVATGAIPFMPSFFNDDLPGVYTSAVIQKMMNIDYTLLGKNIITIGAGNIGYLTSYQLYQAGANIKAIIEGNNALGGFPVQANRIRRLGIPIVLAHLVVEAIPNKKKDGIIGVVVAEAENMKPKQGTEKVIYGIDTINVCTGLISDNELFTKGKNMFGGRCFAVGDAMRIGEGTSAVLRGFEVAFNIISELDQKYNYEAYLKTSKEFLDSQQKPIRILAEAILPNEERQNKPYVIIDCLFGFACNPCTFVCPHDAIKKNSTNDVPIVDYDKCVGCLDCVYQCPGLAIFGYNKKRNEVYLPIEIICNKDTNVILTDNDGNKIGLGIISKILKKSNKTNIAVVKVEELNTGILFNDIRGFYDVERSPAKLEFDNYTLSDDKEQLVCHCDDVPYQEVFKLIKGRHYITVDEVKHNTRIGMGPCRGKRCLRRLKYLLSEEGVQLLGSPTPRAPLSSQILIGELYNSTQKEKLYINGKIQKHKVKSFIAGGGIAGSSLFRYFAEAGLKPAMINYGVGSSWRNIAAGRPVFSIPELTDIAIHNFELFKDLAKQHDIDFNLINYINFAHDENNLDILKESLKWQKGELVYSEQFRQKISPYFNMKNNKYLAAVITPNCWHATPGKVISALIKIGVEKGGTYYDNYELIDIEKHKEKYKIIVRTQNSDYLEFESDYFVNAMGANAFHFAKMLGIETGLYPVKHQAFITRRMKNLGLNGKTLDMLIDRRNHKGFIAVYGHQLPETGQIIGCASPANDATETLKNLEYNSKEFIDIITEVFVDWIPQIATAGFQAMWSGNYIEPRMIIDIDKGIFAGLKGQGFMLSQFLAKLYVDKLKGLPVPEYFNRLSIDGDGILEKKMK